MILVLFEVKVKKEGMGKYLELAAALSALLAEAEGFIRSERFSSLANEGKMLSLSIWESEQAVEQWRNVAKHRLSQRQGRESLFESYTITVASSLRIYTDLGRAEAPEDSEGFWEAR